MNFLFLIGCVVPLDLVIEKAGNLGIPLYEAPIIVCKPQEASLLHNHNKNGPILDSLNFTTIGSDTFLGNLMP